MVVVFDALGDDRWGGVHESLLDGKSWLSVVDGLSIGDRLLGDDSSVGGGHESAEHDKLQRKIVKVSRVSRKPKVHVL